MSRVIVALIAVALAAAIFFLWPRSDDLPPDGTAALETTTTTGAEPDTTTTAETPTTQSTPTTAEDTHVVESVEEAEEILRELWLGWFEGIYYEDEDRIREVVGNPQQVEAALAQFGQMSFIQVPSRDLLHLRDTKILFSDESCLAIWAAVDATPIVGAENDGVHIFIRGADTWFFISQWASEDDLWRDDCQSQL